MTENHPCFRYPIIEELDGAEQPVQPFRDEVRHKEKRGKWEIVKKKQYRKKKTDNKASGTPDGETYDHNDDDVRIVIDGDQRETEQRSETYAKQ